MKRLLGTIAAAVLFLPAGVSAQTAPGFGSEEFGLTQRQLVQAVEQVEELIAKCMREQGFQYIPADYDTVRAGMKSDKAMPGLSEEEFIDKYGFGVATMYTGLPPQLSSGYNPARVGLGDRNVQIFKNLAPADQVSYNHALLGENTGATFAVGLENENFALSGGCLARRSSKSSSPSR
jgi:hypothetical protein